jgi:hypothetical protein
MARRPREVEIKASKLRMLVISTGGRAGASGEALDEQRNTNRRLAPRATSVCQHVAPLWPRLEEIDPTSSVATVGWKQARRQSRKAKSG